jgi:3-methyladenine DNA glycosylase Tag
MMQKDISRTLTEDGLERGSTSFMAILEIMGILEDYKKKCDVVEL